LPDWHGTHFSFIGYHEKKRMSFIGWIWRRKRPSMADGRSGVATILLIVVTCIAGSEQGVAQADWRAASNLEERGLELVWHDTLDETRVGERLTPQMIFEDVATHDFIGRLGGFPSPDDHILETYRTAGHPPGDPQQRAAIEYKIPGLDELSNEADSMPEHRQVPTEGFATLHFPDGVQRAGLAMDFWLPEEATFTSGGRWPIGLWVGPEGMESPRQASGGTPPADQQAAGLRLNRSNGTDAAFKIYSYHLNRLEGQSGYTYSSRSEDEVYGYPGEDSHPTPRGRWVTVEVEIWVNTPGETDGGMALWHDGELVQKIKSGIDWGADRGWAIRGITAYQMWHAGAPASSTRYWVSNIRLYAGTTTGKQSES